MVTSKGGKRFLRHVRHTCVKYGVLFRIGNGKTVIIKPFGFRALGYFDEYERILVCAKGSSEESFLSVVVHEFCHVLQWIEKEKKYTSCNHQKYGSVQNAVCMWINNELILNDNKIRKYTQLTIDCELDAERRALRLIKLFDLPIDVNRYSSQASATLFSYWLTAKTKQWDFKIGCRQREASGPSLRRLFKSIPSKVEISFYAPKISSAQQ